jgi:hypothetical protein
MRLGIRLFFIIYFLFVLAFSLNPIVWLNAIGSVFIIAANTIGLYEDENDSNSVFPIILSFIGTACFIIRLMQMLKII